MKDKRLNIKKTKLDILMGLPEPLQIEVLSYLNLRGLLKGPALVSKLWNKAALSTKNKVVDAREAKLWKNKISREITTSLPNYVTDQTRDYKKFYKNNKTFIEKNSLNVKKLANYRVLESASSIILLNEFLDEEIFEKLGVIVKYDYDIILTEYLKKNFNVIDRYIDSQIFMKVIRYAIEQNSANCFDILLKFFEENFTDYNSEELIKILESAIRQNVESYFDRVVEYMKKKINEPDILAWINTPISDSNNNILLHLAVLKGNNRFVEILLGLGSKIILKNQFDETALYLALKNNNFVALALLSKDIKRDELRDENYCITTYGVPANVLYKMKYPDFIVEDLNGELSNSELKNILLQMCERVRKLEGTVAILNEQIKKLQGNADECAVVPLSKGM